MDWSFGKIGDFSEGNQQSYEILAAVYRRKKSNRHSCFIRCAFREYCKATHERKKEIIYLVKKRNLYPSDINLRRLVRECWRSMPDTKKDVWDEQARFLNSLPKVGEFRTIPERLEGQLDPITREFLRRECDNLKVRFMKKLNNKNPYATDPSDNAKKIKKAMLPHKIEAQNCICQCVIMSPLLIYYLFGDKLDRYKKHFENVSTNAKCEPGFLHIGSKDRLNEVLCVEDVAFATYFDRDMKYNHVFTSMASLSDVPDDHSKHTVGARQKKLSHGPSTRKMRTHQPSL